MTDGATALKTETETINENMTEQTIDENININSDKFFNKKILSKDFSIKFRDSYHECLKSFISKNKREQLFKEGIEAQLISDAALKSAKYDKKLKLLNKI